MTEITYREALREAMADAMREDPDIVVIGEEVGVYGGAYGVTKGLIEEFGEARILDTPISEAGIVGTAVGAAMTGLRPVVEIMYVDFAALVMDQLANQAAKIRYMFGGQVGVPMVLRSQGGVGQSSAAQHSQSLEAWMAHIPGLWVAMPATVNDAYHLLRQALVQKDPVVFLEHKGLYQAKGKLDKSVPDAPWGKALVRRQGSDVTIVTYSRMLDYALEAAENLTEYDISAEVIDLRTLNPLDMEPVAASVKKTNRAVVVTEAVMTGGFSAELSARIQEQCFDWLDEAVLRIAGEDIPIPVSAALEPQSIPSVDLIVEMVVYALGKDVPEWA
jgi:acetoin:2,6-dichlorophenolindophenol oxidoreductase subunit beta